MFPNIDNKSGLDTVKFISLKRSTNIPPVEYILKGLELCLTWIILLLIIEISCKLMVQCKDHIRHAHTAILQYLNLILQLYHITFSQHSRKDFEIVFWQSGHMVLTLLNHFLTILIILIQQIRLNSSCTYKLKSGLSL